MRNLQVEAVGIESTEDLKTTYTLNFFLLTYLLARISCEDQAVSSCNIKVRHSRHFVC